MAPTTKSTVPPAPSFLRPGTVIAAVAVLAFGVATGRYTVETIDAGNLTADALPGLPTELRSTIADAIVLAPTVFWLRRAQTRLLRLIAYPYLPSRPAPTGPDALLPTQLHLAQKAQGLAPKATSGGWLPLTDAANLRQSSLWEFGKAVYLARQSSSDSSARSEVGVVRAVFESIYGREALRQACSTSLMATARGGG